VVTHPTISLAQDKESLPAETSVLTTTVIHLLETVQLFHGEQTGWTDSSSRAGRHRVL